jgi:hypothetical protein
MPIPHNTPHTHAHSHTPAALGAPDEEDEDLRTSPRRGHAVAMPGRTLLERVRAMGHAIWLPKPLPRGCNVRAHNPDGSKPDTRACEDWRLSLDVDGRDHPIAEQDAQAASAALLEGEEKRTPSKSSKQVAAPGTPSTFNTPSTPPTIMPADSEATAQPRTRTRARTPKPLCTAHNFQSGRMVHPGTSPPCLAPSLRTSGVFAEDPDEAGGVTTEEGGAQAHPKGPDGAESTPATKTAGASTRDPRTPVGAKRSPDKPPRKKPPEGKSPTGAARPDAQRRRPHGGGLWHGQHHSQGLAHHVRARVHHRRRHRPPLSLQTDYLQTQRDTPGTVPPHPRSGRPSRSGNISTSLGMPIERQSSGYFATPPAHPTHISHTRRPAAHRRAIQTRRQYGHGPARHIGAHVPHL